MAYDTIGIRPAEILLPAENIRSETWACVACDQYTSEPEYWEMADEIVGKAPSALRLILPECWLKESGMRIPKIHRAMEEYLKEGCLVPAVKNGFVLCERKTEAGTRLGLVCTVDLEDYSFHQEEEPLIRPTEQTITSRLPARLEIRRGAQLELTHIMILIDDPDRTVLEPLRRKKADLRKLYDFDLMANGGHLTGWAVEGEQDLDAVDQAMNRLLSQKAAEAAPHQPMLLAVGDGNHSLATAKAYWEEIRESLSPEKRKTHPARFALCELVNLHDDALMFEPIHRLVTGIDQATLMAEWYHYAESRGMKLSGQPGEKKHCFRVLSAIGEETVAVEHPEGAIPCETVQRFLDDFLSRYSDAEIDFIHGEASLRKLSARQEHVGILMPEIDKNSFFRDVTTLGVLPRKTFSMGEAHEKRYYMEAKRI